MNVPKVFKFGFRFNIIYLIIFYHFKMELSDVLNLTSKCVRID